jgi:NAD-dependent dihydropyrimidine dehydrogenase PreA subunit
MTTVYYILGALTALWLIGGTYRRISRRSKIIYAVEENCSGCKKCLKYCRHNVLAAIKGENGTHITLKNPTCCTACGDCVRACKFNALKIIEKQNFRHILNVD